MDGHGQWREWIMDRWMKGWIHGWKDDWIDRWILSWKIGWVDGWMDEKMVQWDGLMDECGDRIYNNYCLIGS